MATDILMHSKRVNAMEFDVLLEPMMGTKFRASCMYPFHTVAEGETRELALDQLRQVIVKQLDDGAEIVRMRIENTKPVVRLPQWPRDNVSKQWLRAIEEVREEANRAEGIELIPS